MAKAQKKPTKRGTVKSKAQKANSSSKSKTAKKVIVATDKKVKPAAAKSARFDFSKLYSRNVISALWLLGFGLLVFGGCLWFIKIYKSPERVFWGTVSNSLSTPGITREVVQGDATNGTSDEYAKVAFGSAPGVVVSKTISQNRQEGKTTIKVEGVGTLTDDFQHYSQVDRPALNGKSFDYSKLYGIWVHSNATQGKQASQDPQLLSQTLLNTIMFGNLVPAQRNQLVSYLKNNDVYEINANKVATIKAGWRPVYQYDLVVKTRNLALALQKYGQMMGLKNAQSINPNSYSPDQTFAIRMQIDVLSREVRGITYTGAGVQENYYSYGVNAKTQTPKNFVDVKTYSAVINQIEN